MDTDYQEFLQLLDQFCQRGYWKKVYATDQAIVCNVYDQFYIAFSRKLLKRVEGYYPGFTMNSIGLKNILEDENFVNTYYGYLSPKEQDKVLVMVDESLLDHFEKRDQEFRQRPPGESMDLAFEAELLNKGVDAMRAQLLANKPKKRSIFDIFKRKKK